MKTFTLNCPNCNASLETNDGIDSFFCKNCGAHIQLDDLSKEAYQARLFMKEILHKEHLMDKEIEQERARMSYKAKEKQNLLLLNILKVVGITVAIILVVCSIVIPHKQLISRLEQLEIKIEAALKEGDFDSALFMANKMYCDDNLSSEDTALWNTKRENYIGLVEQRRLEATSIEMQCESKTYINRNYQEVTAELESIGFHDIVTNALGDLVDGFLSNKQGDVGRVARLSVGGATEFKKGEWLPKDAVVIIYYHTYPK